MLYHEGGETLEQVAQCGCEFPLPGSIQGQMGLWATWSNREVSLPTAVKHWHCFTRLDLSYCSKTKHGKFQLISRLIFKITAVKVAFTLCIKYVRKPSGWKRSEYQYEYFPSSTVINKLHTKRERKKYLPTLPKLPFPNTLMKLNSSRPIRLVCACLTSPFSPFSPGLLSWLSADVVAVALCSSPRLSNDNAFLMLFSSSLISVEMRKF